MATKGYILDNQGTSTSAIRYDDQQGDVQTALTGAAQWDLLQIRDTGFIIGWFRAGQDDFVQQKIQFSHRKALGTPIASLHLHYILEAVPAAEETVNFDYAYTWVTDGGTIPAIASWTASTKTLTFTGDEAANTSYRVNIVENIAAPANEGYSSIFLIKIIRNSAGVGADTYDERVGVLYLDAHFQTNRLGSVNEATD